MQSSLQILLHRINLKIDLINYNQITQPRLAKCDLFILLGGKDKLYAKYLNGKYNDIIRTYVKSGGSFLGICAGAYYAGSKVEFAKNTPKEVVEERELAFFNGTVIGPVLGEYFYNSLKGTKAAKINIGDRYTYVHYNGGGYFPVSDNTVEVISYYQNHNNITAILPAIIKIPYEKGMVILSGVHFEYCTAIDYGYTKKDNIDLLKTCTNQNNKFFIELISSLIKKL